MKLAFTVILAAALLSFNAGTARDGRSTAYEQSTEELDLLTKDLAGDPGREVKAQLYTIPAKATLPWHIHPDAQEFVYVLDGPFTVEVEDAENSVKATVLDSGDVFYIAPDAIHRGINGHATDPAKLYVVRIKPKDAPLVEEVEK